MICVAIYGGLGNQMFQYACAKDLALKNRTTVVIDTSSLSNNADNFGTTNRSFELSAVFGIKYVAVSSTDLNKLKPIHLRMLNVLFLKFRYKGVQFSKYFIENKFSFNHKIDKVGIDCYLSGYWQSPKYFHSIETLIRKEFTFQKPLDYKNLEILNLIKNTISVSIHIRRTDFEIINSKDIHGFCSLEYYIGAINYIRRNASLSNFFIFSDDINWAKENLKVPVNSYFVSGNTGGKSYIDMQLMSNCNHNIIANSSFSWWGAWLNSNPNKIVIAPKKWFSDEEMNAQTYDLIPEKWIRM
jgi:hypothetical protein